jgi:ABC-type Fe3+/spermidine/putrescine transport system ATPase subunit
MSARSAAGVAPTLEVRDVAKSFGAVAALRSGALVVESGSIHALVGENGAGKSTMVKITVGVYRRDAGSVRFRDMDVDFGSTAESKAAGIAVIYQEPTLFPDLSVAQNLFMGRQPLHGGRRIGHGITTRHDTSDQAEANSLWMIDTAASYIAEHGKAEPFGSAIGVGTDVPVIAVGPHDTASAVVGVPAEAPDFAYISSGTWSLVGLELDKPILTEAARQANFTNETGVDGTIRFLKNVTGLWVLSESVRAWADKRIIGADLPSLLAQADRHEPLRSVIDINDARLLPPPTASDPMLDRVARLAAEIDQPLPRTPAAIRPVHRGQPRPRLPPTPAHRRRAGGHRRRRAAPGRRRLAARVALPADGRRLRAARARRPCRGRRARQTCWSRPAPSAPTSPTSPRCAAWCGRRTRRDGTNRSP